MSQTPSGITSAYAALSTIQIPGHWSAEQALAVFDFLNELSQTIWHRYELQLVELIRDDLYGDDTSQLDLFDPDDAIPLFKDESPEF